MSKVNPVGRDEIDVGNFFFVLSKLDDPSQLPAPSDMNASAGWEFFKTISDASGGVKLKTFQELFRKIAKRGIQEFHVDLQISSALINFISSFSNVTSKHQAIVQDTTSKFIEKLLDVTPVFSTAIFRLFGNQKHQLLTNQDY